MSEAFTAEVDGVKLAMSVIPALTTYVDSRPEGDNAVVLALIADGERRELTFGRRVASVDPTAIEAIIAEHRVDP